MLPNFLVIGAQKCGTTWFHNILRDHPDIFVPRELKETMFLDTQREFDAGLGRYEAHFAEAGRRQAVGEVTPGYLWSSRRFVRTFPMAEFRGGTPLRARALLGADLRLIVILRDPVRRAISAYLHHRDRGRFKPGATMLMAGRRFGIIAMGFYAANLVRWLDQFAMRNFLFLSYEELAREPLASARATFAFLGVDREHQPAALHRRYDVRDYEFSDEGVTLNREGQRITVVRTEEIDRLARLYAVPNRQLARLVPSLPINDWIAPRRAPRQFRTGDSDGEPSVGPRLPQRGNAKDRHYLAS